MNWADFVIVGILSLSIVVSVIRGLLREVFALATWAVAFWVAYIFADRVAPVLEGHVGLPSARIAIAFSVLFLLVLLLGGLLGYLLGKLVERTGLSATDRLLGSLFGAVRGVLIVVIAVMLAGFTPFSRDPWWHESTLLPPFENMALLLRRKLPELLPRVVDIPDWNAVAAPPPEAEQ